VAATPSVSIITICKNSAAAIERTLQSVVANGYPDLEYVVVDGGSTDGTLQILDRYRQHITKLVSEPDGGISDALNKAIELTTAEYHLLVHADDVLLPGALTILRAAAASSKAHVVCGSVLVMDGDRVVRRFVAQPEKLTRKMSIPHMGALVRKEAWRAVGGYDLNRRIAMDHRLVLRILLRYGPAAFTVVDEVVAQYRLGGLSDRQVMKGFREVRENLIDEGFGVIRATWVQLTLMLKSKVSRIVRGA
jgi:glycosyltransferase involved in cell wall biosynthesis